MYVIIHDGEFVESPKRATHYTALLDRAFRWGDKAHAKEEAEPGDFILSIEEVMAAINEALSKRRV